MAGALGEPLDLARDRGARRPRSASRSPSSSSAPSSRAGALLGALVALPVALPPLVGVIAFLFLYGESGFASRGRAGRPPASTGRRGGSPGPRRDPARARLLDVRLLLSLHARGSRAARRRVPRGRREPRRRALRARRSAVTLPLLSPALSGAALLTFMTSLASFSAPYVFGGSFRVMTTQIVASKLNGDIALAMVETVALAAVGFAGLCLLRRTEAADGRRRGPRRRAAAALSRGGRLAVAAAGWALAALLLLPHATLLLVSLVPRNTWTTEALPPVLDLGNYASALRRSPSACARSSTRSGWPPPRPRRALLLGFAAAYARRPAASAAARRGPLETLIAAARGPCPAPSSPSRSRRRSRVARARRPARFVLVGTARDPAARLPRAQPAAHGPRGLRRACASSIRRSRRPPPRSAPRAAAPLAADRPAARCARARRGREPRLPLGAGRLRRLDRALHLSTRGRSRSRSSRRCACRRSASPPPTACC